MADYEVDITRTIWNNKYGTKIIIKPDADGTLVEVIGPDGEMTFTIEEARLLAPALLATATEIEAAV